MGAVEKFTAPASGNPFDADLDSIRDNYNWLLMQAVDSAGVMSGWSITGAKQWVVIPGWNTLVDISGNNNYAQPDAYVLTRGTRTITFNYTWTNSVVSALQMCYNDGVSGEVCLATINLYYIGGEFIGTVQQTALDFFAVAVQGASLPDAWDVPNDVKSDVAPAEYIYDYTSGSRYTEYLRLSEPAAAAELPAGAIITNIEIEIDIVADQLATVENSRIAAGTVQDYQWMVTDAGFGSGNLLTFSGDPTTYWGMSAQEVTDFLTGDENFEFQAWNGAAGSTWTCQINCYTVKCRFSYVDVG